jgi:hypothetical protein
LVEGYFGRGLSNAGQNTWLRNGSLNQLLTMELTWDEDLINIFFLTFGHEKLNIVMI